MLFQPLTELSPYNRQLVGLGDSGVRRMYPMHCHTTLFEVNPTARIDIFVECCGLSVDFLELILVVDGLLVGSLEVEPG